MRKAYVSRKVEMCDLDKVYCSDYMHSKADEVALGRAALDVVKRMCSRVTLTELLEIGCAIDSYIEGDDDFSRAERIELDAIESRLGLMVVWVDPGHVWVRHHGSIDAVPVEWGWTGSLDE